MAEERNRILQMLADGKIKVEEAERLLDAVAGAEKMQARTDAAEEPPQAKKNPKWLRVQVMPKTPNGDHVNIRVPLMLVKAGMKLKSFVPKEAQAKVNVALKDHGMDFDLEKMDRADMDEIFRALCDLSIDVDDADERVIICCE